MITTIEDTITLTKNVQSDRRHHRGEPLIFVTRLRDAA